MKSSMTVIGWDIGGVNSKVARVEAGEVTAVLGRPFELQRAPSALVPLLRELADEVGGCRAAGAGPLAPGPAPEASGATPALGQELICAVTMTAELSQMFRSKREGVAFVLDAMEAAFPAALIRVFTVDGRFVSPAEGRQQPLAVAAANWAATAHAVAAQHPDALLVDIGTTSTDIIPIVAGRVVAAGHTDPERLASGELVYTGVLRTPIEALASHVAIGAQHVGVSAEGFALAGDVHLWRGDLAPEDYSVPTPDGRPATREFSAERLARVVCADRELLSEAAISSIAAALAEAQQARITAAMTRVVAAHPSLRIAVVTGLGAFLGVAAARAAGLQVVRLAEELGAAAARCAPAAAVALLLERELRRVAVQPATPGTRPVTRVARFGRLRSRDADAWDLGVVGSASMTKPPRVDVVVKVGGGILAQLEDFEAAMTALAVAARGRRVLVVPGGGPFADAVRDIDRRVGLSDDAAHWMSVLAMDQYAHLVASRLEGAVVITTLEELAVALAARQVPVLAPARWLKAEDPLPHSWDVTSDSIAAWIAGALGARRLVIVKPPYASGSDLVDAHFSRALPVGITPVIVTADRLSALHAAIHPGAD